MPRGIPNKKTPALEPLIMVHPTADGQLRLNAYELDDHEVIAMLRRALLHVVATRNGARVIDLTVPAQAAVVAQRPARKTPASKPPTRRRPGPKPKRQIPPSPVDGEEMSDEDLRELMEAR